MNDLAAWEGMVEHVQVADIAWRLVAPSLLSGFVDMRREDAMDHIRVVRDRRCENTLDVRQQTAFLHQWMRGDVLKQAARLAGD
jgi:hypothetical protein